jgi:MFS family permease
VLWTVLVTEGGTAAAIAAILISPLIPALIVLPVLGVMLNGTSSVLYGTVPELAPPGRAERAFATFYTGTIGSGAIAPVLFGIVGDATSVAWATVGTATTAMITIPFLRRVAGVAVAEAIEGLHRPVTPTTQRGALVEELVRAAKSGILKHGEHGIIGIAGRSACDVRLLRQSLFEWCGDGGEFGKPARPIGAIFFKRAAEGGFAGAAVVTAVLRIGGRTRNRQQSTGELPHQASGRPSG